MRSAVENGSALTLEELIAKLVLPAVVRVVEVPQWRQLTVDDVWDEIRTTLRQVNSDVCDSDVGDS